MFTSLTRLQGPTPFFLPSMLSLAQRNRMALALPPSLPPDPSDERCTPQEVADPDLNQERRKLPETNLYHDRLPPITCLPPEILGAVFAESCTTLDNNLTEVKGTRAMILATVCKTWRDTALSTPEIWAKFRLYGWRVQDLDRALCPLKLHLKRSHSFPLTFIINHNQDPGIDPACYTPCLDALFAHAYHWGNATLSLNFDVIGQRLAQVDAFPALEALKGFGFGFLAPHAFHRTPNLRHLEFSESHIFLPSMPMPWPQIISLSFWRGMTSVLDIVRQCTQLQRLDVRGTHFSVDPLATICTSRLCSLYMCISPSQREHLAALLTCLVLPVADRVGLEVVLEGDDVCLLPRVAVTTFLLRCKSLEDLEIHRFYVNSDQLVECLVAVPSLVRFQATIGAHTLTEEVREALDQLLRQQPRLSEINVIEVDDQFQVEYRGTVSGDNILSNLTNLSLDMMY